VLASSRSVMTRVRILSCGAILIGCVNGHKGIQDDQISARSSLSSHRLGGLRAKRTAGSGVCAGCVAVLPDSYGRGRPGHSGLPQAEPRAAEQDLRQGFDGSRAVTMAVIPGRERSSRTRNPARYSALLDSGSTRRRVSRNGDVKIRTPVHVLLPAGVAAGSTSLAALSGVSSFQRTDPNGRSSMRRTRTGSTPIWKAIAR
jgi:hypothetical protein